MDNGFLPEVDVLGGNKTSPASSTALQIRLSYLTPFRELSTLFWCQGERKKKSLCLREGMWIRSDWASVAI